MQDHPHEGGCPCCHRRNVCNYCGETFDRRRWRCTNGRCRECHEEKCGPGGATSVGHGYWRKGAAEA